MSERAKYIRPIRPTKWAPFIKQVDASPGQWVFLPCEKQDQAATRQGGYQALKRAGFGAESRVAEGGIEFRGTKETGVDPKLLERRITAASIVMGLNKNQVLMAALDALPATLPPDQREALRAFDKLAARRAPVQPRQRIEKKKEDEHGTDRSESQSEL